MDNPDFPVDFIRKILIAKAMNRSIADLEYMKI
jgi:hypothetical protein